MPLDTEHSARGKDFAENFNELAEGMFKLSQEIKGLVRF